MNTQNNVFLCFLLFCEVYVFALEFKDITSDIFVNNKYSGLIAAFGDFNSDKLTDLFIINQNGKSIEILLSNESIPLFGEKILRCNVTAGKSVTALIPGDFNGDSEMDVLISFDGNGDNISGVTILWGALNYIDCNNHVVLDMIAQPLIIDYDDDMIPDIMSEDRDGKRCVWISNTNKTSNKIHVDFDKAEKLRIPHSSSIVDLNNDLISDLVVTGETKIEVWIKQKGRLNFSHFINYPKIAKIKGQSTFVDFDTDGKLDHIMPICSDNLCKESAVMMWDNNSSDWIKLIEIDSKHMWGFLKYKDTPASILDKASLPITLRAGDFNMDGSPDFVVVLENKTQIGQTKGVILENIPCTNCPFGRTLQVQWKVPGLDEIENIKLATFYDIYDDGTMDILAVSENKKDWQIHALKNMDTYDAYFIKVLVLSGLCYTNCTAGHIPYGTNSPGPIIRYNTTKPNGEPLASCAVQMSQTAYFPLHLPYSVFGLGQTPNFVDLLTVAIPAISDGKIHKREWTQIIPNSQMVVIPHPPYDEHSWVNKLFLTPSRLVLLTFLALLGTCGFISMIIIGLHWKERLEDKKEKMQEAYRFHFDAM